jgi:hypothetical protein
MNRYVFSECGLSCVGDIALCVGVEDSIGLWIKSSSLFFPLSNVTQILPILLHGFTLPHCALFGYSASLEICSTQI